MQTYNGYAYKIKSYVISYDLGPKQLLLHQYKVKLFTLRGGRGNQKRQRIEKWEKLNFYKLEGGRETLWRVCVPEDWLVLFRLDCQDEKTEQEPQSCSSPPAINISFCHFMCCFSFYISLYLSLPPLYFSSYWCLCLSQLCSVH